MEKQIYVKKQAEVQALTDKIENSKLVIAFDYQGLTSEQFNALRASLRKSGCECKVYKNNIARRAAANLNHTILVDELTGPKAMLFSNEDIVTPAKILYDFSKENDKVKLSAGVVESQAVNAEKVVELANMPSYETLLTMLAAGLLAPVRDVTIGLHLLTEQMEEAQA